MSQKNKSKSTEETKKRKVRDEVDLKQGEPKKRVVSDSNIPNTDTQQAKNPKKTELLLDEVTPVENTTKSGVVISGTKTNKKLGVSDLCPLLYENLLVFLKHLNGFCSECIVEIKQNELINFLFGRSYRTWMNSEYKLITYIHKIMKEMNSFVIFLRNNFKTGHIYKADMILLVRGVFTSKLVQMNKDEKINHDHAQKLHELFFSPE
jgi:hypothetical protein